VVPMTMISDGQKVKASPVLSVVVPAFNEEEAIVPFLQELDAFLLQQKLESEIILVDDGSSDCTVGHALNIPLKTPLSVVRLSRNFGKENAMTAGLHVSSGDAIILMDADGQDPPALIEELVRGWREGYDMVVGVRHDRKQESFSRKRLTQLFYCIATAFSPLIERNTGDFRLMSRRVADVILSLPESNRFMKGLYNWVGYRRLAIPYEHRKRIGGKTKFTFPALLRFGMTGLISFSTLPLRLIGQMGLLVAACAILYGLYIMVRTLHFGIDVPGWATVVVALTLLGGVQLISLGILGEYIGQIFIETKRRPIYVIETVIKKGQP